LVKISYQDRNYFSVYMKIIKLFLPGLLGPVSIERVNPREIFQQGLNREILSI